MREDDVHPAMELAVTCFQDLARRRHEPVEPGPDLDVAALRYRRCLRADPGGAWVAEQDGAVVGFLVLRILADHALVENVAVAPAVRGTGVGAALLDLAEAQARERHRPELRLYTHALMTRNLAYYAQRGFHETSREGGPEPGRVFMTKPL